MQVFSCGYCYIIPKKPFDSQHNLYYIYKSEVWKKGVFQHVPINYASLRLFEKMASLSQVWILQVLYLHQHPVIWRMKAAKRLV